MKAPHAKVGPRRMVRVVLTCAAAIASSAVTIGQNAPSHPDLSGYWGPGRGFKPDQALVDKLPPNTVILPDSGAPELAAGDFGGLRLKSAARAAASKWKPQDEMTISKVCVPPSIVYSMQGPFPMEIHQATELIVFKLEYYDLVRVVFMDGRAHPPNVPSSKVGHSIGRWEGSTLVVDTTHISESTIANNGLNHSDKVHVVERFWLSPDAKTLFVSQEFEDPTVLDNRGVRFIAWDRVPGEYVYPYECDPSFSANYKK